MCCNRQTKQTVELKKFLKWRSTKSEEVEEFLCLGNQKNIKATTATEMKVKIGR